MCSTADGTEVTGYYECRNCGYRITTLQYMSAIFDFECPRCHSQTITQFKKIPGDTAA